MQNYKLVFFVPENTVEEVKKAIFATGAGSLGNYAQCSWQTLGVGQFLPLDGANPTIGKVDTVERVSEWRVEILCSAETIKEAVSALKTAHPYEEPAFEVYALADIH
ncbi:MAG: NGG1p interacting factor NIF3 [Neptuniibacter caesariensis]|uniref:NGG1p interacting factor NIF3 n=1 Tax=Neptuniibacter caesariensis TaxID=207954 RepID=A0A2G6JID6_NEPCE|nr:MAG: NGG1p interacting factor NIF3 [Neptuniibacter caesariensis]